MVLWPTSSGEYSPQEPNVFIENGELYYRPISDADKAPKAIGGSWDKKKALYKFPARCWAVEALKRLYGNAELAYDDEAQKLLALPWGFEPKSLYDLQNAVTSYIPHWIWDSLKPYQREAVHYVYSSPRYGSMIALSPGLGKTLTGIAAAYILKAERILVICPVSLMVNWHEELTKWARTDAGIYHQEVPDRERKWSIVNYETVTGREPQFQKSWDIVIVDESIMIKNRKAKRTVSLMTVRPWMKKVLLLSGLPISRFADDLYAQLELIDPKVFTSYWRFAEMYCHIADTPWGKRNNGSRRNIDLRREFRDYIFARNHSEVMPDLPKILYETYHCELLPKQLKAYRELRDDLVTALDKAEETYINETGETVVIDPDTGEEVRVTTKVAGLIKLQQVVSNLCNLGTDWSNESAKLDMLVELLEVGAIPTPSIIWVHWRESAKATFDTLKSKFPKLKIALVLGQDKKRDEKISDFKQDKYDLIVLSLSVGKYGHTMINAKSMVYFDKTWDADAYLQSLARIDGRIGLQHRPYVITLKCKNTTDDIIEKNLRGKAIPIAKLTNADLKQMLGGIGG